MNMLNMRTVTEADSAMLQDLARRCHPLDVHTPYTYWVVCRFFGKDCFLLEREGEPVGYIMTVETPECLFVWQIGLLEPYRGQKLSQELIHAVVSRADAMKLDLQVSIAADNAASYSAFFAYCRDHGMALEPCREISLRDLADPSFREEEIHYCMKRK